MDEYPKITIVTPCYNDAAFLETTILSVLDQNYPNLEYIIVDGGSTDGSVGIIEKYANRLAYWISEKDHGMYFAIQKGFERSTGEIMGWINSDDILHRGSLFILAEIFGNFDHISWVQGYPNTIDERGRIVMVFSWLEIGLLYFYMRDRDPRKYIQQESTFWRRSLWAQSGSYVSTDYKLAGDFELWRRFFQHARLFHLNSFIGSFRVSSFGQASIENFDLYIAETHEVMRCFPLSRQQRTKLTFIQIFNKVERLLRRTLAFLKRKLKLIDPSTVIGDIVFDGAKQKFRSLTGRSHE